MRLAAFSPFYCLPATASSAMAINCRVVSRSRQKLEECATTMQMDGFDVSIESSLRTLTQSSQLIVTTTPAKQPLIHSAWVQPGTHITAMGADSEGKQELESSLVARADNAENTA